MGKFELYGAEAERLYCKEGKTLAEIQEILQVSQVSLSDWSQKGEWPEKRAEHRKNPQAIEERVRRKLYAKLESICEVSNDDFGSAQADQVSKLLSALGKLDAHKDPLRAAVTVMDKFVKFLRQKDSGILAQLQTIIPDFFEQVREENGR